MDGLKLDPLKEISDIADNATKALKRAEEEEIRKLPVNIFKIGFLPYMTGEKEINKANLVAKWAEVAGDIRRPVDLVDDSGNVLDRVPPLINTSIFEDAELPNLDKARVEADLKNKMFPGSGDREYEQVLASTLRDDNSWDYILSKYSTPKEDDNTVEDDEIELVHDW